MAFFGQSSSVIAKHLHSKLTIFITTPHNINTLKKVSSFPIISSSKFGVFSSKFGVQKRGINTKMVVQIDNNEQEEEEEEMPTKFRVIKDILDHPVYGDPFDCLMRNTMRIYFSNSVHNFVASKLLLPNHTLTLFQLVLIDENRFIQRLKYKYEVVQDAPDVAEFCREIFRVTAPCLLHDTDRWVFSRSLVLNDNSLITEALKFTTLDPVGGLRDIPIDMPLGTPDAKVHENFKSLLDEAVKFYKREPFEMPFIRCAEVFMFIAGDYDDVGLNSREGVQKLLRELYSEKNMARIYGFDLYVGSAKVIPEKLGVIRDMHLTA